MKIPQNICYIFGCYTICNLAKTEYKDPTKCCQVGLGSDDQASWHQCLACSGFSAWTWTWWCSNGLVGLSSNSSAWLPGHGLVQYCFGECVAYIYIYIYLLLWNFTCTNASPLNDQNQDVNSLPTILQELARVFILNVGHDCWSQTAHWYRTRLQMPGTICTWQRWGRCWRMLRLLVSLNLTLWFHGQRNPAKKPLNLT